MAVRKICRAKGCRSSPRCDHPWWLDVMHQGRRWRMRVDEFALARGATEPVISKQTADRVWEPRFLGEIMAGQDPRITARTPRQHGALTVAAFLERYYSTYVEAEGLKSAATIKGQIKALKASLGELPVAALEKPPDIARFKAEYRHGHEVATVNRALGLLRAAINWGRFQDPPLLSTTPFHRFGISIKTKEETKRDRRIHRDEEQALLARSASRRRLPAARGWRRYPDRPTGARTLRHQDDAAIPQHHRRGTAEGADRCVGAATSTARRRPLETAADCREPLRIVSHLSVSPPHPRGATSRSADFLRENGAPCRTRPRSRRALRAAA